MSLGEFKKFAEGMINSPEQKLVGDITTGYHYVDAVDAIWYTTATESAAKWRNNGDILCDFCKKWGISYEINFGMYREETEIRFEYRDTEIKILVSEMDRNLDGVYRIIDKLKVVFDLEEHRVDYNRVDYNLMFKNGKYIKKAQQYLIEKENDMNRNNYIWEMDVTRRFTIPEKIEIKDVIFNDPATIVKWSDDTKTIVKCQDGDKFDPEKGLALAICKKALGNKGNFNDTFKKWLPKEEEKELVFRHYTVKEYAEKIGIAPVTLRKHILKGKYPEAVKIADKWYIPVMEEV